MAFVFSTKNSSQDIWEKRNSILKKLCESDPKFGMVPVQSVQYSTLQKMLSLYDELFFAGSLEKFYSPLNVTMSSRLLKSAGKFVHYKGNGKLARKGEIRMSSDFLFRLKDGPFHLNGLTCNTPQEAFLIVFEHELIHAIEYAIYGDTGHSDRFLGLAYGIFGHTKTTHELPTRESEAAQKGIRVGSKVTFPYQGKRLVGIVSYVGKTARVMVEHPAGTYFYPEDKSRRYVKFEVPLSQLTRVIF